MLEYGATMSLQYADEWVSAIQWACHIFVFYGKCYFFLLHLFNFLPIKWEHWMGHATVIHSGKNMFISKLFYIISDVSFSVDIHRWQGGNISSNYLLCVVHTAYTYFYTLISKKIVVQNSHKEDLRWLHCLPPTSLMQFEDVLQRTV
jgi:hypothetical protein